jgi:hypothetical protein
VEYREAFLRPGIAAPIYRDLLTRLFGKDWIRWEEPETVWQTIGFALKCNPDDLPQLVRDKISAWRTILNVLAPYQEPDVFENAALTFNDQLATWNVLEGLSVEQAAYFMTVAPARSEAISDEVRAYMGAMAGQAGWALLPGVLRTFQPALDSYLHVRMSVGEVERLKAGIKKADNAVLALDNDQDPASVGAVRLKKVDDYIDARRAAEANQRRLLKI